jgi:tripartite-type tricarboxylate transporter receptor subunit TctC
LSTRLGKPFVTEFKGGAAGIIGTDAVAKAPADGYTLLAATSDMLVNNTAAFKSLPYDPRRDFAIITQVGSLPLVFAVSGAVPGKDVRDFAAQAARSGAKLSYGSWGYGINAHIAGETLLNRRLQLGATHAPYRGLAPLTQDLVGQQITASFGVAPAFAQFAADKRLKVLGVTGTNRIAAFPDVPTFAEQGFADDIFQLRMWMALLAPAGTPTAIVELLNREVIQIVRGPEFQALLGNAGFEPVANSPQQARENLLRELAIVPSLMQQLGFEAQ